jgi:hypothetical protein
MMRILPLEAPPVSGEYDEVCFDAIGACVWFLFEDDEGTSWVGVFGRGLTSRIDFCVLGESSPYVFIIALGQGYLLDTERRTLMWKTDYDVYYSCMWSGVGEFVVVTDYTNLYLFDRNGEVWRSERIALDGIKLHESVGLIEGEAWQHFGWQRFTFDVATRTIEMFPSDETQ